MRPKDSEPDDRDLNPNQYIHYIQEHGKECDRIEPELNKQFMQNTLKRAAESGTPFQTSSKFILGNNSQIKNNNILSDANNPMRRNLSYASGGPSSFMPNKELRRTPPGENNRFVLCCWSSFFFYA